LPICGPGCNSAWGRAIEEADRTDATILIVVLAAALAVWFWWRLLRGRSRASLAGTAAIAARRSHQGADSEFYRVEARLAALGWTRPPSEALAEWLDRIAHEGGSALDMRAAREALRLHYLYRFDPDGIAQQDRDELKRLAERISAGLDQAAGARLSAR
jgi:hypothetical protein